MTEAYDFDKVVQAGETSYGIKAMPAATPAKQPAVLVTNTATKGQFLLRQSEAEKDTGEIVDAKIHKVFNGQVANQTVPSQTLPENVRNAMADAYAAVAGETGNHVAEEVLENLREGKEELKAPPYAERQKNASFRNIMKNSDLDAEIARTVADERVDVLLDELNGAVKSGDAEAIEAAKAGLTRARAEQPALEEAAEMLAKPKDHFMRQEFEAKHMGDAIEGERMEESHVERLKTQRAAEQQRGGEGPAR